MSQSSDLILANAYVLTMDEELTIYHPGAVVVRGENIIAVGPNSEITVEFTAQETIDCEGKVLMPGIVNAHTHAAMALLRGLADDLRLDVWLLGYVMPVEREFVSPKFVRLGTSLACIELIKSGVTCFADMYYFEEDVARSAAEAGMRAICGQTVMKFPTPDAQSYEISLESARDFISRWKNHPLITPAIAPHAPFTSTEDILQAATSLAVEFDVPLLTHLAETAIEVENSKNDHGERVIPYVENQNIFDAKVIAAHCVHLDDSEIFKLQQYRVGIAHNPSSNLKLASGIAPVSKMLNAGLMVGIGTDGAASNNDLDMFAEIHLTALLAKGSTGDPTSVPAKQALSMATRIGACALHLGDVTGSLEPGKRADLILVDVDTLHNSPRFRRDPESIYSQLVYAAKSTDVSSVMVNGKWLMRERNLQTLDEQQLLDQVEDYAHKIDEFLIKREQSVLSKLIAIGGATEQESFEVQVKVKLDEEINLHSILENEEIEVLYYRHYHEYDTYFIFEETNQGQLRYREDEYIGKNNEVTKIRYRLTLIGPTSEHNFPGDVLLSRSRYIAEANHSLRFYREYFKPRSEFFIEKDRLRWRVLYQGTEFYINLDTLSEPGIGTFMEVKSRTWSRRDADNKAVLARELLTFLGASPSSDLVGDYVNYIEQDPIK